MRDAAEQDCQRRQAQSMEELQALHQMCREGRLYDVERWIAEEKPLQLAPETILKGSRPKTALQIALETGQHSLAALLLKSGYRLDLERYAPLDLALEARRWDLFDLLLAHGADLEDADVMTRAEWEHRRGHEGRMVAIELERVSPGSVAESASVIACLAAECPIQGARRVRVQPTRGRLRGSALSASP